MSKITIYTDSIQSSKVYDGIDIVQDLGLTKDASDAEIEEAVLEWILQGIDWGWYRGLSRPSPSSKPKSGTMTKGG